MSGTPGPGIGAPSGSPTVTTPSSLTWAQIAVLLALGYALPFVEEIIRNAESGKPVTLGAWEALKKLNARTFDEL